MKKLGKFLLIAILVLTCSFSFAACDLFGSIFGGDKGGGGGGGGGGTFEYGTDYIETHLGNNFWIIYTVTGYENGKTSLSTWEQKRTENGIYYAVTEDGDKDEILFIKSGESYLIFDKDGDGEFVTYGDTQSKEMVELQLLLFNVYMGYYSSWGTSLSPQSAGSQTIAQRDCAKYTYEYNYPGYGKFKYTFCIDKETGACMKVQAEVVEQGQKAGYEFECTKFQRGGVTLPDYQDPVKVAFPSQLPALPSNFVIMSSDSDSDSYGYWCNFSISGVTLANVKAYVGQLKIAGFTFNAYETDPQYEDYSYEYNADNDEDNGYNVTIRYQVFSESYGTFNLNFSYPY